MTRKVSTKQSRTKVRVPHAVRKTAPLPAATGPSPIKPGTKTAIVIGLLRRDSGATLQELQDATGWQAHSVRGFLSGTLRKARGLCVVARRNTEGVLVYHIA